MKSKYLVFPLLTPINRNRITILFFNEKSPYFLYNSEEGARTTYDLMCEAYFQIMERMGLKCVMAEADTGNIGGKRSHEFHVLSKVCECHNWDMI